MLGALETDPDAFTATLTEHSAMPLTWWEGRVSDAPGAAERVFGAFSGERIAGIAGLRFQQRTRTRHKATLFGMYVLPLHRGHGIGSALVETVLTQACAHPGTQLVQLTVVATNNAARRLYETHGFRLFGVEPFANKSDGRFTSLAHMWCPVDETLISALPEPEVVWR